MHRPTKPLLSPNRKCRISGLSGAGLAALLLAASPAALAQPHQPGALSQVEDAVPQGEDPPGPDGEAEGLTKPNEPLSEELDENSGVIEPPATGDGDIHVPAPDPDPGTTVVIPPPGTPGGDQSVDPK